MSDMTDHSQNFFMIKKCMHPRVIEVLQMRNPPSPVVVPRDNSQPRAGNLLSVHREHLLLVPEPQKRLTEKPQVTLSLESCLLRRRKQV
ncbi:hypothetical protein SteCoe_7768 [Stentor coeruleus]|uniref:Uncharacterized protein n=1 Tax=Stentor coeruleus TaxID=5963 RepID=A0A1R2CM11_9CILI|nr:hypothetical protein SteCoe_7768 [Stentor coeruleus]